MGRKHGFGIFLCEAEEYVDLLIPDRYHGAAQAGIVRPGPARQAD